MFEVIPENDAATSAYARFESLLETLRDTSSPLLRPVLAALALRCGTHPALAPIREDPLTPLNGSFVSLDAQLVGLSALSPSRVQPETLVGSVGGALYLPASRSAAVCRVHAAYLSAQPLARWDRPVAVHPVSPDLEASAITAFEAALHVLLYVCPGEAPPVPAPILWCLDGIEDSIAGVTAGDSLELPLTLAFLSALTNLPIGSGVGATGAVREPDKITSVGFTGEKRNAFLAACGASATFLTPEDGTTVRDIACVVGDGWRDRYQSTGGGIVAPLPHGVIPTCLCVGIENAPVFWERNSAVFRSAVGKSGELFATSVAHSGGQVFGTRPESGEGMGAVFADPVRAIDAAVHFVRSVRAAVWDEVFGESLPVRVGIHRGDGEPSGDAWRGVGPALAGRIAGAASAFQILASASVHRAIQRADWVCHGSHRLRDLSEAVILWQVPIPGIATVLIPPESLDTRPHNLPDFSAPLFGKDGEVKSLLGLLAAERCVTLTGAGGVGKTRLAVAAATRALLALETSARFPDGVFYVALDEENRGENSVADTVRAAMMISADALATRKLLLVLDNAEGKAADVADFIRSLNRSAPHVAFLVTSRVPLRVRGERRVSVAPLVVPGRDADVQEWEQSSAVRLFIDRARACEAGFEITTQTERDDLTRLLRRLDGLPLAIELAAARTRYLSVAEIESRLADSLQLLATREPDVPPRQCTLLATLEWSCSLLSESEERFLRSISVFAAGGFDLVAAEAVTGEGPDTLEHLATLEEHSLLVCSRSDKGLPPRFSLLQTVSDFVKGSTGGKDRAELRERHADYFVKLAERNGGEDVTLSPREKEAFDALDRDMANIRTAWSYLREIDDRERLAILAVHLTDFVRRRGHSRERLEWVEIALAKVEQGELQRRLLFAHAMTLRDTGRAPEALEVAEQLQTLIDRTGDPVRRADVFALRASIATRAAKYADSEQLFDAAEALYQGADNKRGIGTVWSNRAVNAIRMDDQVRAEALLRAALGPYDEIGDEQGKAYVHNNLGHLLSEKGEYEAAIGHYVQQLTFCRSISDTTACAVSLFNIGEAFLHLGRQNGLPLVIAAGEMFSRLGHPYAAVVLSDAEAWREKTHTALSLFTALRRAANRRTLTELRESPFGV